MNNPVAINVTLPAEIYDALHTKAELRGVAMSEFMTTVLAKAADYPKKKRGVYFMASLPKPLHKKLKQVSLDSGVPMRELLNQAAAQAVGIQL